MENNTIKMKGLIAPANRVLATSEYYFSGKLEEIGKLRKMGVDVINLGIGSPDLPPPRRAIDRLIEDSKREDSHSYQGYKGVEPLRDAFAQWYWKNYNVRLNPATEVLPLIGSKEGIFYISMAFLNPGDQVLIPDPGYPAYRSVTQLVGGNPVFFDLKEANSWYPDLDNIRDTTDLTQVKMMWVNYPNMPTGSRGDAKLFDKLVRFGMDHNILICNDNPYSMILNDHPMSLLAADGARDICLELNSLSKSHNMSGWRIGMVAGAEGYLKNILKVSSNIVSGMFLSLQNGAVEAMREGEEWHSRLNIQYERRRKLVFKMLDYLGCTYSTEQTGMFVWAKIPESCSAGSQFSDELLTNEGIFITPGFIFGKNGEKHVRISLCTNEKVLEQCYNRLLMSARYEQG